MQHRFIKKKLKITANSYILIIKNNKIIKIIYIYFIKLIFHVYVKNISVFENWYVIKKKYP